jgi:PadR family transcriptional regulator PadR
VQWLASHDPWLLISAPDSAPVSPARPPAGLNSIHRLYGLCRVRDMQSPRMTLQTQLVLRALLEEPSKERYGLELCAMVGLPSGTIYPILARLEQVGWIESAWEDPATHQKAGRPARRFYRMTPDGVEQARSALVKADRSGRWAVNWGAVRPRLGGVHS